jgi:tetratricopeptide (TPR) repeat protein
LLETGDTEKQLEYLSIKACILLEKDNDIEGELTVLGEQEKIAREHGFLNILDLCLSNIGDVYLKLGDNTRALALFKEAAQIARRIGHGNILCVSLINEGIAFESLGQLDDAMAAFGESEKILRESKSWEWLALSLQGQGRVLVRKNSLKEALPLYSEAEQMLRESGSFMLAEFLGDYAMVLARLGDHDGCAAHLKEMETLCRKHGLNRVLQLCLEQQRALLEKCKSD